MLSNRQLTMIIILGMMTLTLFHLNHQTILADTTTPHIFLPLITNKTNFSEIPPPSTPTSPWDGTWQTSCEWVECTEITFTQIGNQVIGTFSSGMARVEGTLTDNHLVGTWYHDGDSGPFDLWLSESQKRWHGNLGGSTPNHWCGWQATTPAPKAGSCGVDTWYGTWHTECTLFYDCDELIIHQDGFDINGSFASGDGRIEGSVIFGEVSGIWERDYEIGSMQLRQVGDLTQFIGNLSGSHRWCGYRTGATLPDSCRKEWEGTWHSPCEDIGELTCGTIILQQNVAQVIGSFADGAGAIEGVIQKNHLTGTWAVGGKTGTIDWWLNDRRTAWSGNRDRDHSWCGAKSTHSYPSPCRIVSWYGEWETFCSFTAPCGTMTLTQNATEVEGVYANGQGTISGQATSTTLSGQWSKAGGNGSFYFKLINNGSQFHGNWDDASPWCGHRDESTVFPNPCFLAIPN